MSDLWRIVLSAVIGVGTGVLSGMFGIGGAVVSTPAIRVLGASPLAAVGLSDRAAHFPAQLSGGEQQRVSIARALATDPDLLLADEPAGALDVATGRRVLELLQQTSRAGRGVIMVTHNEAAAEIADYVMHMRDGAIVSADRNTVPADAATIRW